MRVVFVQFWIFSSGLLLLFNMMLVEFAGLLNRLAL